MTITFAEYDALWRQIDREGPFVHYFGNGDVFGDEGHFDHVWYRDGNLTGAIGIHRAGLPDQGDYWTTPSPDLPSGQPADLLREYITLAHEYGHYLSWNGATPRETWEAYHRAIEQRSKVLDELGRAGRNDGLSQREGLRTSLSDNEKALIVAEETRAWELGRPSAPERLWTEYDRRAAHGVHCHRYRMGLDELWPEDAE